MYECTALNKECSYRKGFECTRTARCTDSITTQFGEAVAIGSLDNSLYASLQLGPECSAILMGGGAVADLVDLINKGLKEIVINGVTFRKVEKD